MDISFSVAPFSASGYPHHHTGKLVFALGLLGVGHKVPQLLAQPNSLPHPQFPWPFWSQRRDQKSPVSGCPGRLYSLRCFIKLKVPSFGSHLPPSTCMTVRSESYPLGVQSPLNRILGGHWGLLRVAKMFFPPKVLPDQPLSPTPPGSQAPTDLEGEEMVGVGVPLGGRAGFQGPGS